MSTECPPPSPSLNFIGKNNILAANDHIPIGIGKHQPHTIPTPPIPPSVTFSDGNVHYLMPSGTMSTHALIDT